MKKTFQLLALAALAISISRCASTTTDLYEIEDVEFYSHETKLSGSIIYPDKGPIQASVVFVHGSGPMTRFIDLAKRFSSEGIAAFVYDKRGVGRSGGTFVDGYCPDSCLNQLADDAVAAMKFLSKHKRFGGTPMGFVGISQAGWIIPLAAVKSPNIKFVGLWSGCVCKNSEEDIYSQYMSDRDFIKGHPSFEQILETRAEPYVWDTKFGNDIDPSESLKALDIFGFWIFGTDDGSIPTDLSIARLKQLQDQGKDKYEYVLFSDIGHATIDRTFLVMTDWIKKTVQKKPDVSKQTVLREGDLDKYLGTYESTNPQIKIIFTKRDTKLMAEINNEIIEMEYMGDHSFFHHKTGIGYIFLDFNPSTGVLMANQQGLMYNFRKVKN